MTKNNKGHPSRCEHRRRKALKKNPKHARARTQSVLFSAQFDSALHLKQNGLPGYQRSSFAKAGEYELRALRRVTCLLQNGRGGKQDLYIELLVSNSTYPHPPSPIPPRQVRLPSVETSMTRLEGKGCTKKPGKKSRQGWVRWCHQAKDSDFNIVRNSSSCANMKQAEDTRTPRKLPITPRLDSWHTPRNNTVNGGAAMKNGLHRWDENSICICIYKCALHLRQGTGGFPKGSRRPQHPGSSPTNHSGQRYGSRGAFECSPKSQERTLYALPTVAASVLAITRYRFPPAQPDWPFAKETSCSKKKWSVLTVTLWPESPLSITIPESAIKINCGNNYVGKKQRIKRNSHQPPNRQVFFFLISHTDQSGGAT